MNCPVCKTTALNATTLEKELPASICPNCGGTWVSSTSYWRWLEQHGPHIPEKTVPSELLPVSDSKKAKLCPECTGGILIKYKVGHELGFAVDQCGRCKGIWLDKNEWDVLKARNFHDEIHLILDAGWQKEVRREEAEKRMQALYAQRFGSEVYAEIKRVREWLAKQPQRSALLAYLNDTDPYKEKTE